MADEFNRRGKQGVLPLMQETDFEHYVKNRYEREIAWYGRRAQQNQWGHRITQVYTMAASVTIPVLLKVDGMNLLAVSALAASVAAVQAFASLIKFHENWLTYRTTTETLKKEIHFYRARIDQYASANDPQASFVERVEALISRENTLWLIAAGQTEERRTK